MKYLLMLVLLMVTGAVAADCDRATVLVGSKHFGNTQEFNEVNPGVLIECGAYGFGGYRNSENRNSSVFYRHRNIYTTKDFDIGYSVGAVTGYKDHSILPVAIIYGDIRIGKGAVRVMVFPAIEHTREGAQKVIGVIGLGVVIEK